MAQDGRILADQSDNSGQSAVIPRPGPRPAERPKGAKRTQEGLDPRKSERRQPERRKRGWTTADEFDYEAEARVFGRRQKGSEKRRATSDPRKGERRKVDRRAGPLERRTKKRRENDEIYRDERGGSPVPDDVAEGSGRVVAVGARAAREKTMPTGNTPRRPPNTAAAIAAGLQATKPWPMRPLSPQPHASVGKKHPEDNFVPLGQRIQNWRNKPKFVRMRAFLNRFAK